MNRCNSVTCTIFHYVCWKMDSYQNVTLTVSEYNSILLTVLKFSCMVRNCLCPRHCLLIYFNDIKASNEIVGR